MTLWAVILRNMRELHVGETEQKASLTLQDSLSEQDAADLRLLLSSEHPIVRSFPHGAVFVFDHDLRYLSAGGLGLADVGLSREALVGKTVFEAFPPETAALIEPLYRATLTGESSSIDVPYEGRIFVQRLAPILSDSGQVLAGMGFTQDATESRGAERHLRESEQRSRLTFEFAPIGQATVGLDGRFLEVNPALCRLLGYPSEKLRSLTFQELTHPDDLNADMTQLAQLVDGQIDNYAMEKRYFRADGALVWAMLTVSLVVSDDGEPLYFISQIQDITDRKTVETALAEAHARDAALLQHAATHDVLTGLPNRRFVDQQLSNLLDPSERRVSTHGLAVLFCDLDGFKAVNDQHGHDEGDRVLIEAASRLVAASRDNDIVGRVGGDEFVIVMATRIDEDAQAVSTTVAQRICAAFTAPFSAPNLALPITISIGIALSENGIDSDELLRNADIAMYDAKVAGKNRYALYRPDVEANRPGVGSGPKRLD